MIKAYFDGSCWPNPGGKAGYGYVIKVPGKPDQSESGYIGMGPKMSNNVAEYCALNKVLIVLRRELTSTSYVAMIYGDSDLVIGQMGKNWIARKGLYLSYYKEAKYLMKGFESRIRFQWIPREMNSECDQLSKSYSIPKESPDPESTLTRPTKLLF